MIKFLLLLPLRARLILLTRSLTVVLSFLRRLGAIVRSGEGLMVVVMLRRETGELRGFGDLVVVVDAEKGMEELRRSEVNCCIRTRKLLSRHNNATSLPRLTTICVSALNSGN